MEVEAPAIGFESIAHRLAACKLDETYRFIGFLANRSRKSKRIVFHIVDFESNIESNIESNVQANIN